MYYKYEGQKIDPRSTEELNCKINKHYLGYNNCPLGIEYTESSILLKLYEYIRGGRAYSIKEALDLYLQSIK